MIATEIITTQRLCLRSPVDSDIETLHKRIFLDAQVMHFVFGGVPLTISQSSEFFASAFDHEATGLKLGVLVEKNSLEVIGFSGLIVCNALNEKDYEIGFVLSRSSWGKGYATEIGQGQLDYGFSVLGCERLLAQVAPKNTRSITVLKKIGMVFNSTIVTKGRGLRQIYVAYNRTVA
jgi:RimJ/RimL family protein N-acetyltransferase